MKDRFQVRKGLVDAIQKRLDDDGRISGREFAEAVAEAGAAEFDVVFLGQERAATAKPKEAQMGERFYYRGTEERDHLCELYRRGYGQELVDVPSDEDAALAAWMRQCGEDPNESPGFRAMCSGTLMTAREHERHLAQVERLERTVELAEAEVAEAKAAHEERLWAAAKRAGLVG